MSRPHSIPFELRARETVKAGFRRLGDALANEVLAQVANTAASPDSAVHETRLAVKRLRAAVRLFRGTLGDKATRRHQDRLREAARRLAPVRDQVVGATTLDALEKESPEAARLAIRELRSRLAPTQRAKARKVRQVASHLTAAAQVIRSVSTAIDRAPWRLHGWETLEQGLTETYRRARRRFRAAHTTDDEESFHRWRTAVKAFMYQLSLIRPVASKRLGRCIKDLNSLQRILGDEHDLSVLAEKLAPPTKARAKGTPEPPRPDPKPLKRLISSRQQRLRKKALKEGRRLFGERPKRFMARIHQEWRAWHRPIRARKS